jgi:hypothetical protein
MFVEHCRCRSFQRQNAYPLCFWIYATYLSNNLETRTGLLGLTETNHVNDRQWFWEPADCARTGSRRCQGRWD